MCKIFGENVLSNKYKNKIYPGLFDELMIIYNYNITTNNISKSIKVFFNWTRLSWYKYNENASLHHKNNSICKYCRLCSAPRREANSHLIWLCTKVEREKTLDWLNNTNSMTEKKAFLEKLQEQIDSL